MTSVNVANDLVHVEEGRFMTLMELKDTYGLRSIFFLNIIEYLVQLRTLLDNYLDRMWIFSESIILSFLSFKFNLKRQERMQISMLS